MIIEAPWLWLVAGLLLCAAEAFAPGMFLLWFGVAALATGLVSFVIAPGFEWALMIFGLFAVIAILVGRKVYGSRTSGGDRPYLNRRADALIGRTFVLDHPIQAGEGRIRVNDTVWRVTGTDMPAGTKVKVSAIEDSTVLRVVQA